jgi:hypothetical protein
MSVLTSLQESGVLTPSDIEFPSELSARLDERQWQDVHLAAADMHIRHRLAGGERLELPIRPTRTDARMGLLTVGCGIWCIRGLPVLERDDPRFDVFLFTGDVIKAGAGLPTDPEVLLQSLQELAANFSEGLAVIGVGDRDRSAYQGLQPLIWASRLVINYGPGAVGRPTAEDAVKQLFQRYVAGGPAGAVLLPLTV